MDTIVSTKLRRLYSDWEARRHANFPKRSDFDPVDLGYALGTLSIMEIQRAPLRFRLRLHGTKMGERLGFDLTGKFVDEAPNRDWAERVREPLETVARIGLPLRTWYPGERVIDDIWDIERLVLPISTDGTVCDMLLTAFDQFRPAPPGGRNLL
jgi:hypothetical protein